MVMNGPGSRDMGVVGIERGTPAHVDQGEGGGGVYTTIQWFFRCFLSMTEWWDSLNGIMQEIN